MRFIVSLRKSADPEGGQKWKLAHLTTLRFTSDPPVDTQDLAACETVETDLIDAPHRWIHTSEPQDPMLEVRPRDI